MSESDPIDLSNLQNLQFRPSWVEDLAKSDPAAGEVVWGRAPGGSSRDRDERPRPGGGPRREGGRPFDRNDRGPRPERRGPPPGRGAPPGQGDRRPPPRGDSQGPPRPGQGPPRGERRREGGPDQRGPRPERRDFPGGRRDDRGPQGRPPFRGGERRDFRGPPDERDLPPPLQGWQVTLIPDHRSVEAIARQIKASGRAFSVFDVGRLFMQSRDRYQVRFSRQPGAPVKGKEGAPGSGNNPQGPEELVQCKADGSLWLTRDEAIRHLLQSPALTKYYRAETVTVEAPKGNWSAVAVCGFSGTLLGPPNHHDFQRNVARLHRERFSDMPLDRYKSRIRTEKDEALLQKWQESISSATQYVPVTAEPLAEGAEPPPALKSVAEMEAHFLKHHAADAAVAVAKATVPGNIPGKYLSAPLLGLLRTEVERQQRFPMQLVQDLCRDLESQGLRFFKRDKKTTFVCRNRPHFLPDDLVLSDRIRVMVEMVRANPGITYSRLVSTLAPDIVSASASRPAAPEPPPAGPEERTDPETTMAPETANAITDEPAATTDAAATAASGETPPATADVSDIAAEIPAGAEQAPSAIAEEPEPAAEALAEEPVAETEEPAASGTPAEVTTETLAEDTGNAAVPEAVESGAAASAEAPPAAAPPAPPPPPHLSPEEIVILQDLHWLVQEGYVTEFQNGELWVLGRPPQPPVERKPRPPRPERQSEKSGSTVAEVDSEVSAGGGTGSGEEVAGSEAPQVGAKSEAAPAVTPAVPEEADSDSPAPKIAEEAPAESTVA